MNDSEIIAESKSSEAINAAAVHAEAIEKSREAQIKSAVASELESYFESRTAKGRFIDINRIPFICDDIKGIHGKLSEIGENAITKTDFALLQQKADLTNKIVFAFVGLICLGFMGAVMALVYNK